MTKTNILYTLIAATVLLGIGGCSSVPGTQEFAATANPSDEVQRFASDMKAAEDRQINVLSPSAFSGANKSLQAAVAYQNKNRPGKDILHQVAEGRAQLAQAVKIADVSRTNMEDVVAARQAAIAASAPQLVADRFNDVDDQLRTLTSSVEENDLSAVAESRPKLQAAYMAVELVAITSKSLGPSRAAIALAIKEGAQTYAKQSLAIAEKKSVDTEAFIAANRHDNAAIKARSENTLDAANHLLKITRAAKEGTSVSAEETALRMESEQDKARDGQAKAKGLAVEAGQLKSAVAFNASFEAARAEFTTQEAEIYRQGNDLVIRLRQLEFPVNQSVLRGSNFPLLAKVAKVVKEFDKATIVIEGHTDSDGGKQLNNRLSSERAKAVSDYLVSNNAVVGAKISSIGYGFERPLSSNKSAKGKAENRRVDIIITPDVDAG